MAVETIVRPGAYYDSIVLMQLQRGLAALPGVVDAGVVMGTPANKDVLGQSGLLTAAAQAAGADDLVIVVSGDDAAGALGQVDALLAGLRPAGAAGDYRPKSLEAAAAMLPAAQWVLISVPGRYAAGVARAALRLGKNVFLYSDNVTLEDEIALKQAAAAQGRLVMGPDCGTAIVAGAGLGFANRVRPGPIGLVGASGTGLQLVTARIDQLGSGITHALGTGGRDLSDAVDGVTACQALDLLAHDPATKVIVVVSKPPSPRIAAEFMRAARAAGKPVVIDFIGYKPEHPAHGNLYFVETLDAAAELAVELARFEEEHDAARPEERFAPGQRFLRGLFSGGTLAYEAQLILREYVRTVYSNAPLDKQDALEKATVSRGHTIVDLGEDEFTVGRLHPMMDNDLRVKRIVQEAADPEVAVLLLDVVLGYGAHPDPAGELAPAIEQARALAAAAGRHLEVIAVVVGTEGDPQPMDEQIARLQAAGAHIETSNEAAARHAGVLVQQLNRIGCHAPVDAGALAAPLAAINVGLESFTESLQSQGAAVVHVDWRPPAGGNEKLAGILARLKSS
ncbi:MAG: acyl-CoA synthetase FdrA [Caldilinea sp.]|nr:acyl-CoA synthetase FdrA [Caldilineaceae bacterium]MCO5213959.1 acyl-CoA synthetase FdrA [Caldilinea sp.]